MNRYLITLIIISMVVSGFLSGCDSNPLLIQKSGLPSGSTSSEYQQQIVKLEQQIQSLTRQVDSSKGSISSLERRLETPSPTTKSAFETNIEQQITQLGKQIDNLSVEVVSIKQQLAKQSSQGQATSTPSASTTPQGGTISPSSLEAPPGTIFTFSGAGNSQSLPFNIGSPPWKVKLWSNLKTGGSTTLAVCIMDPTKFEGPNSPYPVMVGVSDFQVPSGISIRETILYAPIPAGTYFLKIHTHPDTIWTVWIVNP
jgi:hypothetical protein